MKITNRATTEIKKIFTENNASSLRIYIAGMGWGGPRLGMVLEEPQKNDVVKDINGIKMAFDSQAATYAEYVTLDSDNGQFMLTNELSNC